MPKPNNPIEPEENNGYEDIDFVLGFFCAQNLMEEEAFCYAVPTSPCKKLLAAIVERAIRDLSNYQTEVRQHSKEWLFDEHFKSWSFRWVMRELDMEGSLHIIRQKALAIIKYNEDNPKVRCQQSLL